MTEHRSPPASSWPSTSTTSTTRSRSTPPCSAPSRPSAAPATPTSPSPPRRSSSCCSRTRAPPSGSTTSAWRWARSTPSTREQTRLGAAGLVSTDERDTTCCYAKQDKFWVEGSPDGERWEFYTVLADSPTFFAEVTPADARRPPPAAARRPPPARPAAPSSTVLLLSDARAALRRRPCAPHASPHHRRSHDMNSPEITSAVLAEHRHDLRHEARRSALAAIARVLLRRSTWAHRSAAGRVVAAPGRRATVPCAC